MGKTFCISGFGRSGTQWLALLADRSPTWSVGHEPTTDVGVDALRWRFDEKRKVGNWGEVNSFVLPILRMIDADRVGVILRCPRQLLVSCLRQGHPYGDLLVNHLNTHLAMIDAAVEARVLAISFARMTTDASYTNELLRVFGVDDVTATAEDLRARTNVSPGTLRWADLTAEKRGRVADVTNWFSKKYSALLATEG